MNILETNIIQIAIISVCALIVLVVLIYYSNLDKWQKPNSCEVCKEGRGERARRTHLLYLSSIFVGIIILFFTYIVVNSNETEYDNVSKYFNFASTMVSIVLAIVTIVYSIATNEKSSTSIDTLTRTAESVGDVVKKVEKATFDVNEAASTYRGSSETLNRNIERIISRLDSIESKVDMQSKGWEVIDTTHAESENLVNNLGEFINNTPIAGINALYMCYLIGKKDNKTLPLNEVGKSQSERYFGYLIAINSLGLVNFSDIDTDENSFVIDYIEPQLFQLIKDRLNEDDNAVYKAEIEEIIDKL